MGTSVTGLVTYYLQFCLQAQATPADQGPWPN